jgi:hypothetical protein
MIAGFLSQLLPTATSIFTFHFLPNEWFDTLFLLAIQVIIYIVLPICISSRLGSQQLTVTEDGLTSRFMGRAASSISWKEARLFARYRTFGAQKSGAALTYELSSARDTVRWTWVRHPTYAVGLKPTLPPEEYNRQMVALLSLVAAKTGLALYDLQEEPPGGEHDA